MITKQEYRKTIRHQLKSLDPVSKAFESMEYCIKFIQSDTFKTARIIFGFMSMKDEVDILPILRNALSQNKKVLLPKMHSSSNDMDFYYITDEPNSQTEQNEWGIYEPVKTLEKADINKICSEYKPEEIAVLVPGLAFGRDYSRIGRGKGFYDKFLSELLKLTVTPPVLTGVCYSIQLSDTVPHDDNDIFVNKLIAEF